MITHPAGTDRERNQVGAASIIGEDVAHTYPILPWDKEGNVLRVVATKLDEHLISELRAITRHTVEIVDVKSASEIREMLRELYRVQGERAFLLGISKIDEQNARDLLSELLEYAAVHHATDLHIEPVMNGAYRARIRVDRRLRDFRALTDDQARSVIAIVKMEANIPVDKKKNIHDGGFTGKTAAGRTIEARVSIMPVDRGSDTVAERVVLRLLGSAGTLLEFEALGLPAPLRKVFEEALGTASGVYLTAGPTGSGKTTTLYAVTRKVGVDRNVLTIEDPVEVRLPNVGGQVQFDPANGVTFANALRGFLRQDPDVMLLGEMRDGDTADVAMNAGLTGRAVLASVHGPDAIRVVQRLVEFGVKRSTISQSLRFVLAQRLVRKLCLNCRVEASSVDWAFKKEYAEFLDAGFQSYDRNEKGCNACSHTGIAGQAAIFEGFAMNDQIEDGIVHEASRAVLFRYAEEAGYLPMRYHAAALIGEGITSIAEATEAVALSPRR